MGHNQALGKGRHVRFSPPSFSSIMTTTEAKGGSVASGDRVVCIPIEKWPRLQDSDMTEYHAVLNKRDTHGASTGGEHARNIDGARDGGVAVFVAFVLLAGVLADCGR